MKRPSPDDAFLYGVVFFVIVGLAVAVVWAFQENKASEHALWGQGYCAALGGEWLTPTVCNVDGSVVPIPEESK